MHEYNFNVDMWWFYPDKDHGKLDAGLWLAVPFEVTEWFDNEADYLARLAELGITIEQ